MSCTRIYVDPTDTPMRQARKSRLIILLKKLGQNTRVHNVFLIIITSKDRKQAFKKSENQHSKRQKFGSKGHFSALYDIIKVSPLPPWTFTTPPYLQPLTHLLNCHNLGSRYHYLVNTLALVAYQGKPVSLPPARIPQGTAFDHVLTVYNSTLDNNNSLNP